MSNMPLSLEDIRSQYDRYIQENPWPEWRSTYLGEVTRLQTLSLEELASPKIQQQIWSLRGLSTLGPGESVNVQGAWTDPKVISAVVALRDTTWPQDPAERASAVQSAYDALLALVHPAHARLKPQARLARLFAGLLPREQHCVFSWPAQRYTSTMLFGRMHRPIAAAVLARARLREALGPEKDLADDVLRSMFFWWLQPNEAEPAITDAPGKKLEATPTALDVILATTPLALLPVQRQRRGLTAVNGYVAAFRAVVQAAQGGATPDDIVDTMRSSLGFADASPDHCRRIFNLVRPLRFLQHKDGLWYPSPDGERLLEEDPPDVLVERLLVETFGLGHLLQLLEERGPLTRKQRNQALRAIYPAWTTDFAPSALGGWAYSLDLLDEREDGRQELTEYGRAWASRLPKPLPIPTVDTPAREQLDAVDGPELPIAPAAEWPALVALLPAIRNAPATAGFVFDDADLRALHLAWHSHPHKRFVILSGLSGTGKTALLRHYAQIYCEQMGLDVELHRAIVPVSPDWRDPSGLLGYFNALHADPTYQAEPALRLVLAASKHPDRPYFLILDEMNLARVEHYFAPFLSAMETGDKLVLHAQDEPVNGVQPWIRWPRNLFIGGTINMDETTHAISDKVLDRAFTLEFWQVDLPTYFDRRAALGRARNAEAETELLALHAALAPIRRHFGYRTASEILGLLDAAASAGLDAAAAAQMLDQAIFSKILPRIRGEDTPQLQQALAAIHDRCQAHAMPRCAAKIAEMQVRLRNTGLTRFWS